MTICDGRIALSRSAANARYAVISLVSDAGSRLLVGILGGDHLAARHVEQQIGLRRDARRRRAAARKPGPPRPAAARAARRGTAGEGHRGAGTAAPVPASPWIHGQDADDVSGLGVDDHRHVLVARLHRQEPDRVVGAPRRSDERPYRRRVLRLALRELGERPRLLRGVEPELGIGHVELREIGEVRAAARRGDHDVGELLRILGLARGDHLRPGQRQRPEFRRGLLPRRLVDRVRGDHLEAVDDEDGVDGPRVEHDAAAVDERRELQEHDHREVETQALLLRVVDDQREERTEDDVDADEEQDQRGAPHRREIGLRVPDGQHQRHHGGPDDGAQRQMYRGGLPAVAARPGSLETFVLRTPVFALGAALRAHAATLGGLSNASTGRQLQNRWRSP